jgi:hypothetical protein
LGVSRRVGERNEHLGFKFEVRRLI